MKQCSRCRKLLSEDNFYKEKRVKDGLYSDCKQCHQSISKKYTKKWRSQNKEKITQYGKEYYQKNKDWIKKWAKSRCQQYYLKNKERIKEKSREWKKKNKEQDRRNKREWCKNNIEKVRKRAREWQRKKRKSSPQHRLSSSMACLVRQGLKSKKGGRKWEELTNYTIQDLAKHLEKQFNNKMSWDNYGKYWEVDHRKPRSLFKYKNSEDIEFKQCWALDNLQPMEAIVNRKKGKLYHLL